jgi:hypothetical protein
MIKLLLRLAKGNISRSVGSGTKILEIDIKPTENSLWELQCPARSSDEAIERHEKVGSMIVLFNRCPISIQAQTFTYKGWPKEGPDEENGCHLKRKLPCMSS